MDLFSLGETGLRSHRASDRIARVWSLISGRGRYLGRGWCVARARGSIQSPVLVGRDSFLALFEERLAARALRGLRMDQAAAILHALTSARAVEAIIGPAGTRKTRVLATAARIWDGPVIGTATSQNATNELRAAGIQVTANTTRLLADLQRGRIPPAR